MTIHDFRISFMRQKGRFSYFFPKKSSYDQKKTFKKPSYSKSLSSLPCHKVIPSQPYPATRRFPLILPCSKWIHLIPTAPQGESLSPLPCHKVNPSNPHPGTTPIPPRIPLLPTLPQCDSLSSLPCHKVNSSHPYPATRWSPLVPTLPQGKSLSSLLCHKASPSHPYSTTR